MNKDTPGNEQKKETTENEKESIDNTLKKADENDLIVLGKLGHLYKVVNSDVLNVNNISDAIESLNEFNKKQEYSYLNNLLSPEKCKGVKIPSPIPVPSCAFQMHNSVTLTTNENGYLAAMFNPFFLNSDVNSINFSAYANNSQINFYGKSNWLTSLWVNNSSTLDGNSSNDNWAPVNISQGIQPVYDQYRLVSASVVVRYIGRLDTASGLIGGAVVFDECRNIGGSLNYGYVGQGETHDLILRNSELAKYGNFELARDSFYHQENMCIEGLRMLYFPVDNSFEEYVKTFNISLGTITPTIAADNYTIASAELMSTEDYYKSGFNFMFYSINAPPSSACFKVDIYCNFECLPNASFLNYLPISMNPKGISSEEKRKANLIIQQKPVMKANEGKTSIGSIMHDSWKNMLDKFSGKLPGIGKLLSNGLTAIAPYISGIPTGLKTGIALTNALNQIMSSSNMDTD